MKSMEPVRWILLAFMHDAHAEEQFLSKDRVLQKSTSTFSDFHLVLVIIDMFCSSPSKIGHKLPLS